MVGCVRTDGRTGGVDGLQLVAQTLGTLTP
jgi:hypothetical protein